MSGSHTSHGDTSHGSVKSYVIGLILSIVLTIVAFGMVMTGAFSTLTTVIVIVAAAVLQLLVQLIMFLHMNTKADEGWNLMSFIFTVKILVLVIGGSLWIMHNLHINMMLD
ncbi:cytochrome o ubiquinol oxidase subunit IV [Halomonas sp. McH1-25]|uniref:cytochrome o ubiquinol oxidase subunit IV n=1 Tax=unclassified Halomonas TaxID=2609666 RepID=UPI001EF43520|nr:MULTISPECIES: cytochrome o ubiquinol oxidase subunit IV [unclassified Halomonas]MCG7600523.1 cytochrome o ubiquinol oxidase subunit IV [Halomonas sp. McH1-25]MCP1344749.1 cytochrome o ubiquinol oxidase subunit IV [Halomonas sp. FL8]MCP1363524.1 cytochrome o ubiquinol oxidase subunit IV [Halomonas sp. BBD45]MCP1366066.1 cytochrome o ubiquinol oxidase subunit IV [Halomonas sp. BBD48]